MTLASGHELHNGEYVIEKKLGQGGQSTVYLAYQKRDGHAVAIKENTDSKLENQVQFMREAFILQKLTHPNLPKVTDHFVEPESKRQYLVMDYIPGKNLRDLLRERNGGLPESDVLSWLEQLIDALKYMHNWRESTTGDSYQIVHRDIKPLNIICTPEGQIFLVDFGLVKFNTIDERTQRGAIGYSYNYSPIEQYDEQYDGSGTDERSDIYALGATLYHLLTGVTPPKSTDRSRGTLLKAPREINSELNLKTEQVILQAMQIRPENRYKSIVEMQEALFGQVGSSIDPNEVPTEQPQNIPPNPQGLAIPPDNALPPHSSPPKSPPISRRWMKGLMPVIGSIFVMIAAYGASKIPAVQIWLNSIMVSATPTLWPLDSPIFTPASTSTVTATPVLPTLTATSTVTPSDTPSARGPVSRQADLCPTAMQLIERDGVRFCLDIFEVTNQEYQGCITKAVCVPIINTQNYSWPFDDPAYFDANDEQYKFFPAVNVPVEQARNYCEEYPKVKETEADHPQQEQDRRPKRLPTFDEWLLAYSQVNANLVLSSELYEVNSEALERSHDDVVGLAGNVKEWVIVTMESGRITQAIAMGRSFQDQKQFPLEIGQLPAYPTVVGSEIGTTVQSDWGFRCAAEPLP